jgi:predicted DNA binding CopG/RHH family protein
MKNKADNRSKELPQFKNENEEREFWAKHSPLDYFHGQVVKASFPNLRPTMRAISIRLPADMLESLKILAHKRDVPYQSLAKMFLAEQLKHETGLALHERQPPYRRRKQSA